MANGQPVVQSSFTIEEVFEIYREDLEEIESQIRKNLDSEAPLVHEIGAHILNGGGKRIRPLLLSLCARLFGYIPKEDLILGSLIEFIHTATLLHDDVVDEVSRQITDHASDGILLIQCRDNECDRWRGHGHSSGQLGCADRGAEDRDRGAPT